VLIACQNELDPPIRFHKTLTSDTDRHRQRLGSPITFKANSHHHARHDRTVLSVSRPLRRCELDSRQLKTVADRQNIWRLSTFRAIVRFTPDTTQTGPSCRVWCELCITYAPTKLPSKFRDSQGTFCSTWTELKTYRDVMTTTATSSSTNPE